MNPGQPIVAAAGLIRSGKMWAGKRLAAFTGKNLFSVSKHNEVLAGVNAFLNPRQIIRSNRDHITIDDTGWRLEINGQAGSGGSGSGSGNMNYRGLYSATVDYAINDVVYTSPDSSTRITWIAEIANGPSSAVSAPVWPETSTVVWRCLDYFTNSSFSLLTITSIGTASDDVITCTIDGGSTSVTVAKDWWSRPSNTPQTWDGYSYGLTYTTPNKRTSQVGIVTQIEVCYPRYVVGAKLFCFKPSNGTGLSGVTWQEATSRVWQAVTS